MNLKHQVYHGIQNREALEMICGDLLPKKAKVWLAYKQKIEVAPKEYKYGVVCYYELSNRFYGIMCGRMSVAGELLPWKRENFMFNSDNADARWRLETELERARRQMDRLREANGTTGVSIFEEVLERMVEKEKQWQTNQ